MLRPCICRNTGGAYINNNGIFVLISAISHAFTLALAEILVPMEGFALAQALALTFAFISISVLGLLGKYTNKYLQRANKLTLELFVKGQKHDQLQTSFASQKQLPKA